MGAFARALPQFGPTEVHVADLLWKDRTLSEGARFLWSRLWLRDDTRSRLVQFTYAALRQLLRFSQSSLIKYIRDLEERGWLRVSRTSRYTVELQACWPRPCKFLVIPEDILLDRHLPDAARWVWGVIRRMGQRLDYQQLMELTGYCHNSLTKYIRILQERGWLVGLTCRVARRKAFDLKAENPPEAKRQKALARLWLSKRVTDQWEGYSFGQFLAARMVELRTQTRVIENGAHNFLDNPETGGRMQIDLFLSKHDVAIEFQGLQHKQPTDLYPGEDRLIAQQKRDELKRRLIRKAGIKLIEIWPHQLSFWYLDKALSEAGVPLRPIPDDQRYVYLALDHLAAAYRASAARHLA